MSWISDVVPYSTILSTWGNSIRDRIVQTFSDGNEMAAHAGSLPDGSLATLPNDYQLYTKRGTFKPQIPQRFKGSPASGTAGANTQGQQFLANTVLIPAGFRSGIACASLRISYTGSVTTGFFQWLHLYSSSATIGWYEEHLLGAPGNGWLNTMTIVTTLTINPAGDRVDCNAGATANPTGAMSWPADDANQLFVIAYP
jgi:hypothetical protein